MPAPGRRPSEEKQRFPSNAHQRTVGNTISPGSEPQRVPVKYGGCPTCPGRP